MRRNVFAVFCASTAVYVFVSSQFTGTGPGLNSSAGYFAVIAVSFLYQPFFLLAGLCLVISLVAIWRSKDSRDRIFHILCGLCCLPMIGYFSYHPEYVWDKRAKYETRISGEFFSVSYVLLPHLMDYYRLHPERFQRTAQGDFVIVDGFADYIRSLPHPLYWQSLDSTVFIYPGDPVKTAGPDVLAPWGAPIRFALDTRHDGYMRFGDEKRSVGDYANPWQEPGFNYRLAVGATVDKDPFPQMGIPRCILNDQEDYRLRSERTSTQLSNIAKGVVFERNIAHLMSPMVDNATVVKILAANYAGFNKEDLNAKGDVLDDWGTPLRFLEPDLAHFHAQSAGPDRKWDTDDDLKDDQPIPKMKFSMDHIPAEPKTTIICPGLKPGEIDLVWEEDASFVESYIIQESNDDGASWFQVAKIDDPSATTYTVKGLDTNKKYRFRIAGFNNSTP
jgi:hypothetical protein